MNVKKVLAKAGIKVVNNKIAKADVAKAVQVLAAQDTFVEYELEILFENGKNILHIGGEKIDVTDKLKAAGLDTNQDIYIPALVYYEYSKGDDGDRFTPPSDPEIMIHGLDTNGLDKEISFEELVNNKNIKATLKEWVGEKLNDMAGDYAEEQSERNFYKD